MSRIGKELFAVPSIGKTERRFNVREVAGISFSLTIERLLQGEDESIKGEFCRIYCRSTFSSYNISSAGRKTIRAIWSAAASSFSRPTKSCYDVTSRPNMHAVFSCVFNRDYRFYPAEKCCCRVGDSDSDGEKFTYGKIEDSDSIGMPDRISSTKSLKFTTRNVRLQYSPAFACLASQLQPRRRGGDDITHFDSSA